MLKKLPYEIVDNIKSFIDYKGIYNKVISDIKLLPQFWNCEKFIYFGNKFFKYDFIVYQYQYSSRYLEYYLSRDISFSTCLMIILYNILKKEKIINFNYFSAKYNLIFFECKQIDWCAFVELATFDEIEKMMYVDGIPEEKILYHGFELLRNNFQ